ncbi:MAG: hypothetical protein GY939_02365 [Actinomycetia bacterium]|nr:hypothetical protein [Actinomycetes bacterium]
MADTDHQPIIDSSIIERPRERDGPLGALVTFRDGVGFALELADTYRAATAGLLIDHRGIVTRQGVAPGPALESTLPTLEWLLATANSARGPGRRRTLLITSDWDRPLLLADSDVHLFCWAARSLGSLQAPLDDWIHTDGDLVRSAAFANDPRRAWPQDPAHDRLLDQATMISEGLTAPYDTSIDDSYPSC